MNKNLIGKRIRANKDNITKMYIDGVILQDIADEYNVVVSTIYIHLRRWGYKIKRKEHKKKVIKVNKFKRKSSKEFLANQAMNTATNDNSKHFKHFIKDDTKQDFDRIGSVFRRKITII